MHLRSIRMKGFKSFPDSTSLLFSPGISVIVGPNGSGKSNVTDAVLWALGEQSPLAVRGQAMQDVIFAGGQGVAPRSTAEVEVVLDNSDGAVPCEFSEISILRRLERSGEGEYRLNGARCRLADVLEAISDTGLGKEMHSVVSQGRVEAIVHSKPRERRLLIEEAAGLGKHRKRRRRAQLKLARTEQNLARSLDVEREARSRLRPLKRQAEAAELHERIERASLEARLVLAGEAARASGEELRDAERSSGAARQARRRAESLLAAVARRREAAEEALADHARDREALASRFFAARSATERIGLWAERSALAAEGARQAIARLQAQVERLERELARERRPSGRLAEPRSVAASAESALEAARSQERGARRELESARRRAADAAAALASVNHFLTEAAGAPAGGRGAGPAPSLLEQLDVDPGFEQALAAALGPRLRAPLAPDLRVATMLLDRAGADGGTVLLARPADGGSTAAAQEPPVPEAERLLDRVRVRGGEALMLEQLLADAWVVDALEALPADFRGIAVTRSGRALLPAHGELRQAPAGGEERVLEARNRRRELAATVEEASRLERAAAQALERAQTALSAAERQRDAAAASEAEERLGVLRLRVEDGQALARAAERARTALEAAAAAVGARRDALERELAAGEEVGRRTVAELRACAGEEADLQGRLAESAEEVTRREVLAQRARDAADLAAAELAEVATRLGPDPQPASKPLAHEERHELEARLERLARRREALGPVNPLAGAEYEEAVEHVEELERQRADLESALAELERLIRDIDRHIGRSFDETFESAAANFEELVRHLFPGGRGRLRLAAPEGPRPVFAGRPAEVAGDPDGLASADADRHEAGSPVDESDPAAASTGTGPEGAGESPAPEEPGVEVEVQPAGKATRRLSLLSGGEKSLVALAFIFAVFLARPCPFYVLDEVEAALDDLNIDRFLELLRRYSDRAQFIVITHQKRTMDVADTLYGVSMGADGVSKVVSRRFPAGLEEGEARDERLHAAPAPTEAPADAA